MGFVLKPSYITTFTITDMDTRTIFLFNSGIDVATALGRGLAARKARVVVLGDGGADDGGERVHCSFASRAGVEEAFAAAVARVGMPQQVVASVLPAAGTGTGGDPRDGGCALAARPAATR